MLVVLLFDPWAVLAPGFWLSFGAVALILYVTAHRLPYHPVHWYQRLWQTLCEASRVQWAMTLGLTPLLLALFQQVSLVSPLANAIAVPLVSLLVVPLTLLGTALPLDFPLHWADSLLHLLLRLLTPLNALPQAVWLQHDPPAWSILLGALGAVWLLLPRGLPARWLGAIWLLPLFLNTPPPPPADTARIDILDVGQGLAVVVQTQQHALLYDSGPAFSADSDSGKRVVVPNLRAAGIAELDGLILSHDDNDHVGGAASVLHAMPVGWIRSSMLPAAIEVDYQRTPQPCLAGQSWDWDGVHFAFLHPSAEDWLNLDEPPSNEQSCVLRISIGNQHVLLTGDMEKKAEAQLLAEQRDQLPTTLLVAPHHGSKTSSTEAFIAATLPEYVVFSNGYRNRFNHPHPDVLQRYRDSGATLLRSDRDGAIHVSMHRSGLTVQAYRPTHLRYWSDVFQP